MRKGTGRSRYLSSVYYLRVCRLRTLVGGKIDIADMCLYEEKPGVYDEELGEYIYDGGDELYIGGCASTEGDDIVTVKFGACCADEVRRIVEKEKYSVKIKTFS